MDKGDKQQEIFAGSKDVKVSGKPKEELAESKKLTEAKALELSKEEQEALLKKLGAKEIPRYEKDRVALILKLQ